MRGQSLHTAITVSATIGYLRNQLIAGKLLSGGPLRASTLSERKATPLIRKTSKVLGVVIADSGRQLCSWSLGFQPDLESHTGEPCSSGGNNHAH